MNILHGKWEWYLTVCLWPLNGPVYHCVELCPEPCLEPKSKKVNADEVQDKVRDKVSLGHFAGACIRRSVPPNFPSDQDV